MKLDANTQKKLVAILTKLAEIGDDLEVELLEDGIFIKLDKEDKEENASDIFVNVKSDSATWRIPYSITIPCELPCEHCQNNSKNGGSGICHCVLPYLHCSQTITSDSVYYQIR